MNKADLLDALEGRLGGRRAASDAVEAIVDIIIREVAAGGKVGITGFGTFERADRAPRTGRNPRTGETVRIAQTSVPKFRPGTQFRDVVADPELLPAEGLAGVRASVASRPAPARRAAAPAQQDGPQEARPAEPVADAATDEAPEAAAPVETPADVQAADAVVAAAPKKAKKSKKDEVKGDAKDAEKDKPAKGSGKADAKDAEKDKADKKPKKSKKK